jgi:hypothetical protein
MHVPFLTAYELGEADFKLDDFDSMDPHARTKWAMSSDIHIYYLVTDDGIIERLDKMEEWKKQYDETLQRWIYPPRGVYDADDDSEMIDWWNPRFATLGHRLPEGAVDADGNLIHGSPKMPDGGTLDMEDESGERHTVWRDGKTYGTGFTFSIKENRERIERLARIARRCSGVTVTGEDLAQVYRERYRCKNVYIFPNSIRFDDYHDIKLKPHGKQVRIMWRGGWSHYRDIYPLRQALGRVAQKYRNARFVFWGQPFRWMSDEIPPTQREHMPWVPFDAFHMKLATIGHDIELSPLADTQFNRSKSAIRFYEASALARPATTIASNVGPYKEIIDGETGLTYDTIEEFEEKLSALIEDATLRKTLAANAKDWVKDNRDAFVTVPKLLEFYRSIHDG